MNKRRKFSAILCLLTLFVLSTFIFTSCDKLSGEGLFPNILPDESSPEDIAYTVTFVSNGGSSVGEQKCQSGGLVSKPNNPYREYYSFAGWYIDSLLSQKWDFNNDKVYSSMTLYAGWEPTNYLAIADSTVNIDLSHKKITLNVDELADTYSLTNKIILPNEQYCFVVYKNKDKSEPIGPTNNADFKSLIGGINTFYLVICESDLTPIDTFVFEITKKRLFSVSFVGYGDEIISTEDVVENDTISFPTDAPLGYTIDYWYTQNDTKHYAQSDKITINSDMVFYAQYKSKIYTITFNTNGGEPVSPKTMDIAFGAQYTFPLTTASGKYFLGWYTSDGTELTGSNGIGLASWSNTGVTEVIAKWGNIPYNISVKRTIKGELDNYSESIGTDSETSVKIKATKPTISSDSFSCEQNQSIDYVFCGWYIAPNTLVSVNPTFTVSGLTQSTEYIQRWTRIVVTNTCEICGQPINNCTLRATSEQTSNSSEGFLTINKKITLKSIRPNNDTIHSAKVSSTEITVTNQNENYMVNWTWTENRLTICADNLPDNWQIDFMSQANDVISFSSGVPFSIIAGETYRFKTTFDTTKDVVYLFEGWFIGSSSTAISRQTTFEYEMPAEDLTFTPKWVENTIQINEIEYYKCNISIDYDVEQEENTTSYSVGSNFNIKVEPNKNYFFDGVFVNNIRQENFTIPQEKTEYECRITENPIVISSNLLGSGSVKYYLSDEQVAFSGFGASIDFPGYTYKDTIMVSAETHNGYVWLGWYFKKDENDVWKLWTTNYDLDIKVTSETIYFQATYKQINYKITVSQELYDKDGDFVDITAENNPGEAYCDMSYDDNGVIMFELHAEINAGFMFAGWYANCTLTDENGYLYERIERISTERIYSINILDNTSKDIDLETITAYYYDSSKLGLYNIAFYNGTSTKAYISSSSQGAGEIYAYFDENLKPKVEIKITINTVSDTNTTGFVGIAPFGRDSYLEKDTEEDNYIYFVVSPDEHDDYDSLQITWLDVTQKINTLTNDLDAISVNSVIQRKGGTVEAFIKDEKIVLLAKPEEGYAFYRWVINNNEYNYNNPYSASGVGEKNFVATWKRINTNDSSIVLNKNMDEAGDVTLIGRYIYDSEENSETLQVNLSAISNDGYAFVGWYDYENRLVSTQRNYSFTCSDINQYFGVEVTGEKHTFNYTAKWNKYDSEIIYKKVTEYSLTGYMLNGQYYYSVSTDNDSYFYAYNKGDEIYKYGVYSKYFFSGWYNSTSDKEVESSDNVTGWNYNNYVIVLNQEGLQSELSYSYQIQSEKEYIVLHALVNDGYKFSGWYSGTKENDSNFLSHENNFTILIDNLSATNNYFAKIEKDDSITYPINRYRRNLGCDIGGSVSASYSDGTYTLHALPDNGYRFVSWNKDINNGIGTINYTEISTSFNYSIPLSELDINSDNVFYAKFAKNIIDNNQELSNISKDNLLNNYVAKWEENEYNIILSTTNSTLGSVVYSLEKIGDIEYIILHAIPNSGTAFGGWKQLDANGSQLGGILGYNIDCRISRNSLSTSAGNTYRFQAKFDKIGNNPTIETNIAQAQNWVYFYTQIASVSSTATKTKLVIKLNAPGNYQPSDYKVSLNLKTIPIFDNEYTVEYEYDNPPITIYVNFDTISKTITNSIQKAGTVSSQIFDKEYYILLTEKPDDFSYSDGKYYKFDTENNKYITIDDDDKVLDTIPLNTYYEYKVITKIKIDCKPKNGYVFSGIRFDNNTVYCPTLNNEDYVWTIHNGTISLICDYDKFNTNLTILWKSIWQTLIEDDKKDIYPEMAECLNDVIVSKKGYTETTTYSNNMSITKEIIELNGENIDKGYEILAWYKTITEEDILGNEETIQKTISTSNKFITEFPSKDINVGNRWGKYTFDIDMQNSENYAKLADDLSESVITYQEMETDVEYINYSAKIHFDFNNQEIQNQAYISEIYFISINETANTEIFEQLTAKKYKYSLVDVNQGENGPSVYMVWKTVTSGERVISLYLYQTLETTLSDSVLNGYKCATYLSYDNDRFITTNTYADLDQNISKLHTYLLYKTSKSEENSITSIGFVVNDKNYDFSGNYYTCYGRKINANGSFSNTTKFNLTSSSTRFTTYLVFKNKTTSLSDQSFAPIDNQTVNVSDGIKYPTSCILGGNIPSIPSIFGGWYQTSDCNGTSYDFTKQIKEDMTLYAKWYVLKDYNKNATYDNVLSINGTRKEFLTNNVELYFVGYVNGTYQLSLSHSSIDGSSSIKIYDATRQYLVSDYIIKGQNNTVSIPVESGVLYKMIISQANNANKSAMTLSLTGTLPQDGGTFCNKISSSNDFRAYFNFTTGIEVSDDLTFLGWYNSNGEQETLLSGYTANQVEPYVYSSEKLSVNYKVYSKELIISKNEINKNYHLRPKFDKYVLTLYSSNVDAGMPSSTTNFSVGATVTLTANANAGFIFEGWVVFNPDTGSKDQINSILQFGETNTYQNSSYKFIMLPEDLIVIALWRIKDEDSTYAKDSYTKYTITYVLNSSSAVNNPANREEFYYSVPDPNAEKQLSSKEFSLNSPTNIVINEGVKGYYKFLGWQTESGVILSKINPNDAYLYANTYNEIILTALWGDLMYTVEIHTDSKGKYLELGRYPQTLASNLDDNLVTEIEEGTLKGYYYETSGDESIVYLRAQANVYFRLEPIRWRIVEKSGYYYQLITEKILFPYCYNLTTQSRGTNNSIYPSDWANSTLRNFLNTSFFKENTIYFNEEEYLAILKSMENIITTPLTGYPDFTDTYAYPWLNQTTSQDYFYIPSYKEMVNNKMGYSIYASELDSARRTTVTDYAKYLGVQTSIVDGEEFGYYMLRSSTNSPIKILIITPQGNITWDKDVTYDKYGVRMKITYYAEDCVEK